MLSRVSILLATTCVVAAAVLSMGGDAIAQMRPSPPGMANGPMGGQGDGVMGLGGEFDPTQLPEFKGKVAQYTLTPRGVVDGLILADGTEVKVSPRLSNALVFSIKPGDQVVIHGLKARDETMVVAVSLTNPANGAVIGGEPRASYDAKPPHMDVSGKVKVVLHNPRGAVNGVLLEDGTTLRLPDHAAEKFADLLKPGVSLAARGFGISNALGKSLVAMEIGSSADKLTRVFEWHHGGGPDGHGPDGHGPDGHGPDGQGPDGHEMHHHMHGPMPGMDAPPAPPAAH